MAQCAKCPRTLDRRNKTGVCRDCQGGITGAARSSAADKQPETTLTDTTKVKGDTAEIMRTAYAQIRNEQELIKECEIDTDVWRVKNYICNKYSMGAKDANGNIVVRDMFQVKAWLERKVEVISARAEIAAMLAEARVQIKPQRAPALVKSVGERHYMLEPAIPDLHLGKLAWSEETGDANYDSKIAERLFNEALETLIQRTKAFQFERVLLPLGHDFFNADNLANETTRGTAQDADSRFQKTFRVGTKLAIGGIERLREVAPIVDVAVVRGNHDTLSAWFLGELLATKYANTPSVRIDNAPCPRKYAEYYKNMILMTHGDKGKRQNYPLLMATEQPEMFGRTIHREAHTGHLHQTRVQEHHGVKVRISPALCSADAWHAENQYVGNARGAEAYTWHRTEGIVSISTYTVPNTADRAKRRA